jgi:aspartate kinase
MYLIYQVAIKTDREHNKARIESVETRAIREDLKAGRIVVVAGFQGLDQEGNITTLGRGGSDATAGQNCEALSGSHCAYWQTPPREFEAPLIRG